MRWETLALNAVDAGVYLAARPFAFFAFGFAAGVICTVVAAYRSEGPRPNTSEK